MSRPVTEADFRLPQFRDAKPEEYEFDQLGHIVRKDRWEVTVRLIANLYGVNPHEPIDCDLLCFSVKEHVDAAAKAGIKAVYFEEYPQ